LTYIQYRALSGAQLYSLPATSPLGIETFFFRLRPIRLRRHPPPQPSSWVVCPILQPKLVALLRPKRRVDAARRSPDVVRQPSPPPSPTPKHPLTPPPPPPPLPLTHRKYQCSNLAPVPISVRNFRPTTVPVSLAEQSRKVPPLTSPLFNGLSNSSHSLSRRCGGLL